MKRRRSDAPDASQLLTVQAEARGNGGGDEEAGSEAKRGRFEDVTFALAGTVSAEARGEEIGKVLNTARKSALEKALEEVSKAKSTTVAAAGDWAVQSRVKAKARRSSRAGAAAARYRLLGEHRQMELEQEEEKETFKVFDVVVEGDKKKKRKKTRLASGLACNDVEMVREVVRRDSDDEDGDYVYDLYYVDSSRRGSGDSASRTPLGMGEYIDRLVNVRAYGEDFAFGDYRDPGDGDDEEEESEDSNAEDHWANDYPDEDEEEKGRGLDYDDLVGGISKRLGLEDEAYCFEGSDLEDYEDDGGGLIESMTYRRDEEMHGASYARFKRRIKKEEEEEEDEGDSDDINELDEYY